MKRLGVRRKPEGQGYRVCRW